MYSHIQTFNLTDQIIADETKQIFELGNLDFTPPEIKEKNYMKKQVSRLPLPLGLDVFPKDIFHLILSYLNIIEYMNPLNYVTFAFRNKIDSSNTILMNLLNGLNSIRPSSVSYALNNLSKQQQQNLYAAWRTKVNAGELEEDLYILIYCFYENVQKWEPREYQIIKDALSHKVTEDGEPAPIPLKEKAPHVFKAIQFKNDMNEKNLSRLGLHRNFSHLTIPSTCSFSMFVSTHANFFGTHLKNNDLSLAVFQNADLREANLENCNFWGADFRDALLDNRVKKQLVSYIQNLKITQQDHCKIIYEPIINYLKKKLPTGEITDAWLVNNSYIVKEIIYLLRLTAMRTSDGVSKYWDQARTALKPISKDLTTAFKLSLRNLAIYHDKQKKPLIMERTAVIVSNTHAAMK